MRTLLEHARSLMGDRPAPSAAWRADIPENLRADLDALLNRLGLAPTVGFDDLVWAVRSRQGELDRLETAILFLDEWKKQYSEARPGKEG